MVSWVMRIFNLAAFLIFTAFCIIVAVSNRAVVSFSLDPLPFSSDLPLYWLLFMGIFIGLGAGALVVIGKSIKQAQQYHKQAKKIRALENQIAELTRTQTSPQEGEGQKPPSVNG